MTRARLQATVACVVTFVLWQWRGGSLPASLAILAATLALLAWIFPAYYAPISRALDQLAHAILIVFTWTILGLVYFGIFVPMRLWRELSGNDPLRRRFDPHATSYLSTLPANSPPRFDRQF